MSSIDSIGEDELVRRLTQHLSTNDAVLAGPGDDCAVLKTADLTGLQLLKTDCIVETVHFSPDDDPERIGWKAAARNVSDIAAMGGLPGHALLTVIVPGDREVEWIEAVYRGLQNCAGRFDFHIVGGETSRSPESAPLCLLSMSLTGKVEERRCVFRSGGKIGDSIFVTGTLGGSLAGKHLEFLPRIREARWLTENFTLSAMMDLSDGMAKDLPRLAKASRCGYRVDENSLPLSDGCDTGAALSDGEDYELLFTLSPEHRDVLEEEWSAAFPELRLSCIGQLVSPDQSGNLQGGWDHFASQSA